MLLYFLLTQKGEAALQEVKEFIQLYSEEISFENFEESVNVIKEIYDEKRQELVA